MHCEDQPSRCGKERVEARLVMDPSVIRGCTAFQKGVAINSLPKCRRLVGESCSVPSSNYSNGANDFDLSNACNSKVERNHVTCRKL